MIPENYAGKVKVGTETSLNFPDIQKIIEVKISVVGNVIDPLSRSFYVEAKLPIDKNFRPNQLVQVKIKDYEKKNAISAPINLLQNDEKGKFIYIAVMEKGKLMARKKAVTVGQYYGNNIEILTGLVAGDNVITEGYQTLFDGQNITTTDK
jgi:multidrug efflux pump subunit AcrA (membrane-fusion protein)